MLANVFLLEVNIWVHVSSTQMEMLTEWWGDRDGECEGCVCVSECTGKFEYLLLDCDF